MTRAEFTRQWWSHCDTHNCWHNLKIAHSLSDCEKIWWWNSPTSWRLTDNGLKHLSQIAQFNRFKQSWSLVELHTPALMMKLKDLRCPWFIRTHYFRNGSSYITELTLFGEKESMWMTLCDGNLHQFLDTWTK